MAEQSPSPAELDHVEVLAAEGAAFIASMREGGWEARVPAIPDWDRLALAAHMGKVWSWASRVVGGRLTEFPGFDPEPTMTPDLVLGYLESNLVELMDSLRTCPDDVPLWSMGAPPGVAFWKRRQAQETVVHRYDAQAALGPTSPIDPGVAGDGISEYVELVLPMMTGRKGPPAGQLTLQATDTGGTWSIGDPAGGSGTLTGPAEGVLLALWRRAAVDDLTHAGDPAVIEGWMRVPSF